jgi:hypothetical protein
MQSLKPEVYLQIELDSLSFLNNSSNCTEISRNQEDDSRRKEKKKKRNQMENQAQTVLNMGLDLITKFIYRLDGSFGESNMYRSSSECV